MVNKYKRTSDRESWDAVSMAKAIVDIVEKVAGYKIIAERYGVPVTTLKTRVAKFRLNPDLQLVVNKGLGRFVPTFTQAQESQLCDYLLKMEGTLHGLTTKSLGKLACDLAEKNGIAHRFAHGAAGPAWRRKFIKRNPQLALRKPQPTSQARARGFTRENCAPFYNKLETAINEYNLTASQIFNVDECGISTVPKHHPLIIARKGKKQVGTLAAAERGQLVTLEVCICADGRYMPPMFVFPQSSRRHKDALTLGLTPGSFLEFSPKGWMVADVFFTWFREFVDFSGASVANPVVLILDGATVHTHNLPVLDYAYKHGVNIITLPPHTTHRLQPLDVARMRPLSIAYGAAVKEWMDNHIGRVVTHSELPTLFGQAFEAAAINSSAKNGFRQTGIWPFNRNYFTDADYAPAELFNNVDQVPDQPVQVPIVSARREGTDDSDQSLSDDDFVEDPSTSVPGRSGRGNVSPDISNHNSDSLDDSGDDDCLRKPANATSGQKRVGGYHIEAKKKRRRIIVYSDSESSDDTTMEKSTSSRELGNQSLIEDFPSPGFQAHGDHDQQVNEDEMSPIADTDIPERLSQGFGQLSFQDSSDDEVQDFPQHSTLSNDDIPIFQLSPTLSSGSADISKSTMSDDDDDDDETRSFDQSTTLSADKQGNSRQQSPGAHGILSSDSEDENSRGKNDDELGPANSTARTEHDANTRTNRESNQPFNIKPAEIRPLRFADEPMRRRRGRPPGQSMVITDLDYRDALAEKQKKKIQVSTKSRTTGGVKKQGKARKRKVCSRATRKKQSTADDDDDDDDDEENVPCLYCQGRFFDSAGEWIQCQACLKWAHCICAGIDDDSGAVLFKCVNCT